MAKDKPLFDDLEITEDAPISFRGSFNAPVPEEVEDEDADEEDVEIPETDPEAGEGEEDTDKEAPEADEEEDEDGAFSYEPLFHDLVAEGILFEGKDKEYDDSPEGFRELVKDSRDYEIEKTISSLPPTAQRLMKLALKGADEEDIQALLAFEDGPNWEDADISEEDVQRAAVEEAMRLREPELDDEEIQERITDLEDLNKLAKQAERDKKFLIKHQETQKAAIENQVAQREQEALALYEQEVKNVKDYITAAETIAGYTLTKEDREGFMAYLTVKDKTGKTQAEKQNTPDRRIQKEFLNFKNFNLGKLQREATTEVVKNVKKQLMRYPGNNGGASKGQPVRVEKEVPGALGKLAFPQTYLNKPTS